MNGPVDLAHLNTYTDGDLALNREILRLFQKQAAETIAALSRALDAGDNEAWRKTAHTLKGAARGIGAFALADCIAEAETIPPQGEKQKAKTALFALQGRANEVHDFIERYLS